MTQLMGHPEFEVVSMGVEVDQNPRCPRLREIDMERVFVLLFFSPEHWNDNSMEL